MSCSICGKKLENLITINDSYRGGITLCGVNSCLEKYYRPTKVYKLFYRKSCGAGYCTSQARTVYEEDFLAFDKQRFNPIIAELLEDNNINNEDIDEEYREIDTSHIGYYESLIKYRISCGKVSLGIVELPLL